MMGHGCLRENQKENDQQWSIDSGVYLLPRWNSIDFPSSIAAGNLCNIANIHLSSQTKICYASNVADQLNSKTTIRFRKTTR